MLNPDKQTIAITGATGFVGRHLAHSLSDRHDVRELDRGLHSLFKVDSLAPLLEDVDVIYHLAGTNAGSGYTPAARSLMENNVEATFNLLEGVKSFCAKKPTIVLLSTIHVYEKSLSTFQEDAPIAPTTIYGFSKSAQEMLLRQASSAGFIDAVIFRGSNIYGEGCRPNYNSAIATFCDRILKGETIDLYAMGKALFDLIYVGDVVECMVCAKDFIRQPAEAFNVASGQTVSVESVVRILEGFLGMKAVTRLLDSKNIKFTVAIDKLRAVLPDFQFTSIEEGLRKTAEGYLAAAGKIEHGLQK